MLGTDETQQTETERGDCRQRLVQILQNAGTTESGTITLAKHERVSNERRKPRERERERDRSTRNNRLKLEFVRHALNFIYLFIIIIIIINYN